MIKLEKRTWFSLWVERFSGHGLGRTGCGSVRRWDWDCDYSSHRRHLRLLVPPKTVCFSRRSRHPPFQSLDGDPSK